MSYRASLAVLLVVVATTLSLAAQGSPSPSLGTQGAGDASNGTGPLASLTGTVRTIDDQGVENARVELRDTLTNAAITTTFTGTNGMFEMYNIPAGQYEVVATYGLSETHERVQLTMMEVNVSLRIARHDGVAPDSSATVSVAQFKVPGKARKEFEKARDLFGKNKLVEARRHADKALELFPTYAEALVIRGILAINDNKLEEGEADLQNAIKYDPNYGMAYIAMGAAMNQARRFEQAKRTIERGIVLAPNSWQAYFEMSRSAIGLGDFEAAEKNASRAETLSSNDYGPIHLVKAHALIGLKRYDEAVTELERFLSKDPANPGAETARAVLNRARAFAASGGRR
ncbi:MAG TPA: tetratricopeptide repeat protein [Clostridia bacterium]|nr:tetratricopeptide repeat protein [Clostridia bacterium]